MSDDGSTARSVAPPWLAQVLDFSFREIGEESWFTASSHVDERVRRRFPRGARADLESDACGLADPRPLLAGIVQRPKIAGTAVLLHKLRASSRATADA